MQPVEIGRRPFADASTGGYFKNTFPNPARFQLLGRLSDVERVIASEAKQSPLLARWRLLRRFTPRNDKFEPTRRHVTE